MEARSPVSRFSRCPTSAAARGFRERRRMELTDENKRIIDNHTIEELLRRWRFSPAGDEWFQGDTGEYWAKRMNELREKDPAEYTAASKRLDHEILI